MGGGGGGDGACLFTRTTTLVAWRDGVSECTCKRNYNTSATIQRYIGDEAPLDLVPML